MTKWAILAITLALPGCNSLSSSEELCRADIKARLINPETAQFFEFKPLSSAEAERLFFEYALKGRGVALHDAWKYGGAIDQMKGVAKKTIGEMEAEGAKFTTYRVKAESKMGMTITSEHICGFNDDQCACFSDETFQD